ncbi:putative bax inhibitor 1-like [Capsicum annuum]|uniref:bax inhibitor 1-like n=1 Tax=Capsicum annuum TaxID=4072 RepID=UPI0007BF8F74|nr:bax inhibitor 1-like [Capsicum annuum]KAF3637962.1 putative bax inhibitor 1-like [Capsicum annuum]
MIIEVMYAVIWYFNRNWRRQDLMNSGVIPAHAHASLDAVYSTFFGAMFCATIGSYLHLFWAIGGLFTVLSSVASLLCLCFTSPERVRVRLSLLMIASFSLGASVGLCTKYLFEIGQVFVPNLLAGSTVGIGVFLAAAWTTRERSIIYLGCMVYSGVIVFCYMVINLCFTIDSHTAHSMFKAIAELTFFMGYLVVYSQEILYDALFGEIDFVNRTLTVFLNLPAVVVHAARVLCLPEHIE